MKVYVSHELIISVSINVMSVGLIDYFNDRLWKTDRNLKKKERMKADTIWDHIVKMDR
jgi:hypothetical protein